MIVEEGLTKYIDMISWSIPPYLEELEAEALENEVPVIRRSMQSMIKFLLMKERPSRILEVGTAVGFSALLMKEYMPGSAHIDTIEKVPDRISEAKANFDKYDSAHNISLLKGDATEILKDLTKAGKSYDFIFMDAAKGQYIRFFDDVIRLLEAGGILLTDNVLQDGDVVKSRYAIKHRDRTIHGRMREYLYTLTHTEGLQTIILPTADGAAISYKF